jgi:hypothetical protein
MKIDWLCKFATTAWKILVNTRGVVDRPKGIVLKVYTLSSQTNLRNLRNLGGNRNMEIGQGWPGNTSGGNSQW